MARCETCGTELQDASQRFCGGDRCHRVFMKRPAQGPPGSWPAMPRWIPWIPLPIETSLPAAAVGGARRIRIPRLG